MRTYAVDIGELTTLGLGWLVRRRPVAAIDQAAGPAVGRGAGRVVVGRF